MGMIYKRGEVFWIKYYSGGKPIRESSGSTKMKQAERFLKDREGRVAIGAPALPRLERIRFAEIAEALIEHYRVTDDRQLRDVQVKLKPVRAWRMQSEPGKTKNREGRTVYLTPELIPLVREQIERVTALSCQLNRIVPYLFPNPRKGRFQGSRLRDFRKAWLTACEKPDWSACFGTISDAVP